MKNFQVLIIFLLFIRCEPIPSQSRQAEKKLVYANHDYERIVGTARILPIKHGRPSLLDNPVALLNGSEKLLLEFDLLTDEFEYLSARIFHCNRDWSPSLLRDMEFLNEINTFRVTDFDYSINTTTPYIQYRLMLPQPMLSGNYIVAVFRQGAPEDYLLTRKFSIIQNMCTIKQQVKVSASVSKREVNQQIDFSVNYGKLPVNDPIREIMVILMQNHCWRRSITNLKPTLIRPNENYLEFRMVDISNNFPGRNEFRFIDLRTLSVTGRNVGKVENSGNGMRAIAGLDKTRGNLPYVQNLRDINGNYLIETMDPGEVILNADYVNVQFLLSSPKMDGNVYVTGRFNDWRLSNENLMQYDERSKAYMANIFLKQGYYNYLYYLEAFSKPDYYFEGSHLLTENDYEIFVYYRRPGNVFDELIGYKKFNSSVQ